MKIRLQLLRVGGIGCREWPPAADRSTADYVLAVKSRHFVVLLPVRLGNDTHPRALRIPLKPLASEHADSGCRSGIEDHRLRRDRVQTSPPAIDRRRRHPLAAQDFP